MIFSRQLKDRSATVWFLLFATFLGVLWLAGGASRADVLGQPLVRSVSVAAVMVVVIFAERWKILEGRAILAFLAACLVLGLVQLIPLPASIWTSLPGRAVFVPADGGETIARPLSIVPGATMNAMASLLVPLATILLVLATGQALFTRMCTAVLGLILVSTLQGALQFSGTHPINPFINDPVVDVVGPFANRNHFALALAVGCLVLPVWTFLPARLQAWRIAASVMAWPLFLLMALATGSRAGLGLCCIGSALGLAIILRPLRAYLRSKPRWVIPVVASVSGGVVLLLIAISVGSNRAVAVDRALSVGLGGDIRFLGLPTVIAMVREYFPFGTGFGGFDPLFRLHEPFELLRPTYFNHAHNDVLEVILDGGLPGLVLLLVAIAWWGWASTRAWRMKLSSQVMLARLGSGILVLIFLASLVDYPARTPLIMALIAIAASWLSAGSRNLTRSALPMEGAHL